MQALSNFSPPGPPQGMMDMSRPPLLGFRPPRLGSSHGLPPGDTMPPPLIPSPVGQYSPQIAQGMTRPPYIVGEQFWPTSQNPLPCYVQRHGSTGSSGSSPMGSPRVSNLNLFAKNQ